jgi:hypothetical protein
LLAERHGTNPTSGSVTAKAERLMAFTIGFPA